MMFKDFTALLSGRENVELHIDGQRYNFTAQNAPNELLECEIESVRLAPTIYLGLIIHAKQTADNGSNYSNPKCTHNMPHSCEECGHYWPEHETGGRPVCHNDSDDGYQPSSTAGDYGPGNPWDAPGMSVRDFI